MVIGRLIFVSMIFLPAAGLAITADELRELAQQGEATARKEAVRAKGEDLKWIVPKEERANQKEGEATGKELPKTTKPTSAKYDTSSADEGRSVGRSEKKAGAGEEKGRLQRKDEGVPGEYIPPPRTQGGSGPLTDAVIRDDKRIFGIRLGTWIKGELKRSATNAEPGLVEIVIAEDVPGDRKTLPVGTLVFTHKEYNDSTKRMELRVEKGITPSGLEFQMLGLVFDLQRVSGIQGVIATDSTAMVNRGASKGLLAAGGEAAKSLAGANPLGAAGSAAAESILSESERAVEDATRPQVTIHVSPQTLLIRVEETF